LSEDPLLAGTLGGAAVRGIQSNHVISTLKHYAINPQETGRAFMNTVIAEDALRESDLLAFEIAIEQGDPGSIMCAYNATNGAQSCGNRFLLTEVLREDWDFQGFVMSDWGAVDGVDYRARGLDQQSGAAIDPQPFFGAPLKALAMSDPNYGNRLRRDGAADPVGDLRQRARQAPGGDRRGRSRQAIRKSPAGGARGHRAADQRARHPAARPEVKRIAVIGGHADAGPCRGRLVEVLGDDGPAFTIPFVSDGTGPFAFMLDQYFNRSAAARRDPRRGAGRDRAVPQRQLRERGGAGREPGRRRDRVRHPVPDRRLRRARPVAARRPGRADRRGRRRPIRTRSSCCRPAGR
jgi:beta-glucosidase